MRDPERIPLILAAIERRWRESPDERLGQMLVNTHRREYGQEHPNPLSLIEDADLLRLLGVETDEERRYVAEEPAARKKGWSEWEQRHIADRNDSELPSQSPRPRRPWEIDTQPNASPPPGDSD